MESGFDHFYVVKVVIVHNVFICISGPSSN